MKIFRLYRDVLYEEHNYEISSTIANQVNQKTKYYFPKCYKLKQLCNATQIVPDNNGLFLLLFISRYGCC
jgi:hypothetical protein